MLLRRVFVFHVEGFSQNLEIENWIFFGTKKLLANELNFYFSPKKWKEKTKSWIKKSLLNFLGSCEIVGKKHKENILQFVVVRIRKKERKIILAKKMLC